MDGTRPDLCTFRFLCNKQWDDLNEISGTSSVRYCGDCTKPVFLCNDYEELAAHVAESRCIAIKGDGGLHLTGDPA